MAEKHIYPQINNFDLFKLCENFVRKKIAKCFFFFERLGKLDAA